MSEPVKKRSNPLFLVVVVVLVAALGAEGYMLARPKKPAKTTRPAIANDAIAAGPDKIEYFGRKSAPIKVEFYAPLALPWHQQTIGLLRDYDKKHPGRISVKLMPMGTSACDEEMVRRGFTCAVIFINGKHEFTLPDQRTVDLQKQPNEPKFSFYNSEDVITILENWK